MTPNEVLACMIRQRDELAERVARLDDEYRKSAQQELMIRLAIDTTRLYNLNKAIDYYREVT
jgi:hypothetical protein